MVSIVRMLWLRTDYFFGVQGQHRCKLRNGLEKQASYARRSSLVSCLAWRSLGFTKVMCEYVGVPG